MFAKSEFIHPGRNVTATIDAVFNAGVTCKQVPRDGARRC